MRGFGDINNFLKKAQELQEKFQKIQEELKQKTVEITVGGGAVKVVANGAKQIVKVEISKELIESGDIDMLQDLIVAGINEAINKSQEMLEEETKKITGGLGINFPGIF